MDYFLGLDFGTSGARAIVIGPEPETVIHFEGHYTFGPDPLNDSQTWKAALWRLLAEIPATVRSALTAIAINGTSGTVVLCDRAGQVMTEPLLYNDSRGVSVKAELATLAPPNHLVHSATSSLAKLLWWRQRFREVQKENLFWHWHLLHQADWLAFLLHGQMGISDYHNALKLGYDVRKLDYPEWLKGLDITPLLPEVVKPGQTIGPVLPAIVETFKLNPRCQVCAGTTDSIAAFLASDAMNPGEAVTSLGSTLVLKLLSSVAIEDTLYGIYSHRLETLWLVGGASNTGGAVLKHFFSDSQLGHLSAQIDPTHPSPLDYYPLLKPGERFPINDPELLPRLEPRPDNSIEFLQGLLESMARIEMQGYRLLYDRGAPALTHVLTAGGGAKNPTWTAIRQRLLGVPVLPSRETEAAYGTALLAKNGLVGFSL